MLLCLCGCTTVTYVSPAGEKFTRTAFGIRTSMNALDVITVSNQVRELHLRGYMNDGAAAAAALTESAVKGAVAGMRP